MATDNCDPSYTIRFFDRSGRSFSAPSNIETLEWGRRLDDISVASMEFVIAGDDCCSELGVLEPMAHGVEIRRDGKQVWYGWLLSVEYGRFKVNVEAFDALGWLKRRLVHADKTWTNIDVATMFDDLWHDAMDIDPVLIEVIVLLTGTLESRDVRVSENRITWNIVREMLDTGLDVTVFGQKILAGLIPTTKPIEIKLSDVSGDVSVTKFGPGYANHVIVDSSDDVQAAYPPGPPAANQFYPLVEQVIKDSQLQDVQSALNAAKARYEYSRRVPRIVQTNDSLVLNPNLDIGVNDLIPGVKVVVDTEGLCYSTKQEFRLGRVDVTMSGGSEQISISLQPVGPSGSLDDIDDPIS